MTKNKRRYIYRYYGVTIPKDQFLRNVPRNWETEYKKTKGYSYGGYSATRIEE